MGPQFLALLICSHKTLVHLASPEPLEKLLGSKTFRVATTDNYDDDNIQVGVRHILDVEEQDWLLREDVAKGYFPRHSKFAIKGSRCQVKYLKPNTPNVLLQIHTVFCV